MKKNKNLNREWYYSKKNEQFGPVKEKDLIDLIEQKVIKGDDLVWSEGMDDWKVAKKIDSIQAFFKAISPPPITNSSTTRVNDSANKKEDETKVEKNNKLFWSLMIGFSFIISLILSMGNGTFGFMIGQTVALLLFPGIITLIVYGIFRLFKKKMSKKTFNSYYFVIWLICLIFSFVGMSLG